MKSTPILEIRNLKKHFPVTGGILRKEVARVFAVDGVTFELEEGTTLGVVGESGCGKSTLGRSILKLQPPTAGEIWFRGKDISNYSRAEMRPLRREMQIVFQDPFFSLNPKHTVEKILTEPLKIHGIGKNKSDRRKIIVDNLEKVGMREEVLSRYPHEFSGGQRQRLGIARALVLNPKLIIADEPVSALDVSIQSQILNILSDLQKDLGLTYIFISHDLAVVEHISNKVAVMYLGQIVEFTERDYLFENPSHPYTQALISAIPTPDPRTKKERIVLKGDVPSPMNPPPGCRFHPRCPHAMDKCKTDEPQLKNIRNKDEVHWVSCHLFDV